MSVQSDLFALQDIKYKEFNSKLVPGCELIGVRIPLLRQYAKRLVREHPEIAQAFIEDLPHKYLEEQHVHAFILQEETNKQKLLEKTEAFLPYIDNWQTCDSFLPSLFKENDDSIVQSIHAWFQSNRPFTRRYAIRLMLFRSEFSKEGIRLVVKAGNTNEYYVYMAAAWYLSMATLHNKADFLEFFSLKTMRNPLYNATLRKICESKHFSSEEKNFYKQLQK